jgi:hypothetical protein
MTTHIDSGERSVAPEDNRESFSFPVDPEHLGIRLAVPALILAGFVIAYFLGYVLLNALLQTSAAGCFAFLLAGGFALLLATRGQRLLEQKWSSGRSLKSDADGLELRDVRKNHQQNSRIVWEQRVNPLFWRFTVKRTVGKVPRGWVMLGIQLLQDETLITVYAFLPDKSARALTAFKAFVPLMPVNEIERDDIGLREKIVQRRLHKAEDQRWSDGGELRRDDFAMVLNLITRHVPNWQENP